MQLASYNSMCSTVQMFTLIHMCMLCVFLQWMLVVATVNVEWPPALFGPYTALSWFFQTGMSATGLECVLARGRKSVPLAVQKVVLNLMVPVAILGILLLVEALITQVRKWRHKKRGTYTAAANRRMFRHAGTFARTSIVAVFFFLPLLLRTVYGLFACVTLDRVSPNQGPSFVELNAPGSYWLLDTDQQCFRGYHTGWAFGLGVPLLLLLCLVLPFGIVGYLCWCRRKNVLGDAYYSQHYGFLYESYTRRCCFWEGVVAMQVRPLSVGFCC